MLSHVQLFATPWTVATRLLCPRGFSRQEYWSGLPWPLPGDLLNLGMEPRPPSLQTDALPSEQPGKPINTGVGSISLFQEIFPTQELNRGLLHCRRILYQLSYQGSPPPLRDTGKTKSPKTKTKKNPQNKQRHGDDFTQLKDIEWVWTEWLGRRLAYQFSLNWLFE